MDEIPAKMAKPKEGLESGVRVHNGSLFFLLFKNNYFQGLNCCKMCPNCYCFVQIKNNSLVILPVLSTRLRFCTMTRAPRRPRCTDTYARTHTHTYAWNPGLYTHIHTDSHGQRGSCQIVVKTAIYWAPIKVRHKNRKNVRWRHGSQMSNL